MTSSPLPPYINQASSTFPLEVTHSLTSMLVYFVIHSLINHYHPINLQSSPQVFANLRDECNQFYHVQTPRTKIRSSELISQPMASEYRKYKKFSRVWKQVYILGNSNKVIQFSNWHWLSTKIKPCPLLIYRKKTNKRIDYQVPRWVLVEIRNPPQKCTSNNK